MPRTTQTEGDTTAASEQQPPTETAGSAAPFPSAPDDAAPALPFPIVGIGASAGGLEAFTAFLKNLPPDTGMAFVLVQHMDPKHESMLHRLMAKHTAMPVAQVEDGMQVEPNHVYVTPSDAEMTIEGGVLRLVARSAGAQRYTPIDTFFSALAADRKDRSIGIVLSGIGSDGTKGLKAIRAEGGITFAQDETSSRYSGMPLHAVAAGCVDLTLPPDQLALQVAGLIHHPYLSAAPRLPIEQQLPADDSAMRRIFRALRSVTGVDFAGYKPSTIRRRIARRMIVRHCDTLAEYAKYIAEHPDEVNALFQDALIHVTSFFRDTETFDYFGASIFPQLLGAPERTGPIRIWVVGCAGGEEVYSIAMLLHEALGEQARHTSVQIFATDLSEGNLTRARAGVYSEAATSDIHPDLLQRYFQKTEGGYQVVKFLRNWCVFARHNVIKDPPFSRLDVVSCRNMLIYLDTPLQKQVLTHLHYALKPGGHLVVGKQESVSAASELFSLADRKANAFVKVAAPARILADFRELEPEAIPWAKPAGGPAVFDLRKEAERVLLDRFAPPGLVVDGALQIVLFQGETSPFLRPVPGEASFNALKLIAPPLMLEIRGAVQEAKKTGTSARREGVRFKRNGNDSLTDLAVVPIAGRTPNGADFLVLFENLRSAAFSQKRARVGRSTRRGETRELDQLRRELATAHDNLRGLVEDREASVEELRAANEEILSSNEELQSTNEELETAKEEMQSSNEELTTVNEELQIRNTELSQLTSDLNGVLNAIDVPIVMLGTDLRIRRFTPPASRLLNLVPADIERPIGQIRPNLDPPNLDRLIADVVRTGRAAEIEAQDHDGRWHAVRLRPYRTAEDKIDGVLLTAIDINYLKQFSSAIVNTIGEAVLVLDSTLHVRLANPSFYSLFRVTREQLEREPLFSTGEDGWRAPRLQALLTKLLANKQPIVSLEIEEEFPIIGRKVISFSASMLTTHEDEASILVVIADITERTQADDMLRRNREELQSLSARLLSSAEDQHKTIARELHDVIGAKIAQLGLQNSQIQQLLTSNLDAAAETLRAQQNLVTTAAQEIQQLARGLHPAILELGLVAALRSECDAYGKRTGTTVNLWTTSIPEPIHEAIKLGLYRISQEALQNIRKHAASNRVEVRLSADSDEIELVVEDFGKGFDLESTKGRGLGLVSMEERARLAGGSLSITTKAGEGTLVRVRIPLRREP